MLQRRAQGQQEYDVLRQVRKDEPRDRSPASRLQESTRDARRQQALIPQGQIMVGCKGEGEPMPLEPVDSPMQLARGDPQLLEYQPVVYD